LSVEFGAFRLTLRLPLTSESKAGETFSPFSYRRRSPPLERNNIPAISGTGH
jgi:hypothetical protein